jgi:hypothetical protein
MMGMFDYVKCLYLLPDGEDGSAIEFQTKDTDAQYMDLYEIREDGTLWHQVYDVEDHSDHKAEGIMRFSGCMTRVREHWVQEFTTGAINFYSSNVRGSGPRGCLTDDAQTPATFWDYTALFDNGKLVNIVGGKKIDAERQVISREEFMRS